MALTPTVEQVIAAVKTAIAAAFPTHDVLAYETTLDDDREYIDQFQDPDTGRLDLWLIDVESVDPIEGPAAREDYEPIRVRARYLSLRKSDLDWSQTARTNAETARATLAQNNSIFRIGGQVPINNTPETVSLEHGSEELEGSKIYRDILRLTVEGRRWG